MILDNSNKKRPEIEYPCEWQYKIISKNPDDAVAAAENSAAGFQYDITASTISKMGKYVSIILLVTVGNLIFGKLEDDDRVVMVI